MEKIIHTLFSVIKISWLVENKFEIYNDIKTKKRVIQYTIDKKFVNEYPSIHDAYKETGIDYRNISAVCNGKRKSTHGYIWKFAS